MTSQFFLGLLNAAAFMLCVSFVAYVTLIVVPFLRHRPAESGEGDQLSWHLLIPCLDEEAVIGRTVESLHRQFPAVHLWCIDDASADSTGLILSRLQKRNPRLHVVRRQPPDARRGKGPALNAGWAAIRAWLPKGADPQRTVIGVVDADSRLDPHVFDTIAGPEFFGDPTVGAVQIQVRISEHAATNRKWWRSLLVRLQDLEFTCPIAAMQLLRRRSGSVGMGGNGQFTRLAVLDRIATEHGTPWHGALLEDFELGLHVLLSGYRNEYCHDTWVEQDGLARVRALVRQRSRWAQGSMQCLRYMKPVMQSPRISTPGALEITYFLLIPWTQLIGGLVYAGAVVLMVYYGLTEPGGLSAWLENGAWGVLPLFLLFGLAPLALWGPIYRARVEGSTSRRRAFALGAANWIYSYLHYAAVWWAFLRIVRRRSDWKKTLRATRSSALVAVGSPTTATARFRPYRPEGAAVVTARLRPASLAELGLTEAS